jgi:hypothetical protein
MNLFFQSMLKYYEDQQADKLNKRFTDLINRNYQLTCEKWRANFPFHQYTNIDNMASVYINML